MAMEQRTRRRPLTRQEQLVLQERKQLRREKMEQSRELAKGPIDLPFCLLVLLLTAIGLVILLRPAFPPPIIRRIRPGIILCTTLSGRRCLPYWGRR